MSEEARPLAEGRNGRVWCACAENMVDPTDCNGCEYRPDPELGAILSRALLKALAEDTGRKT